MKTKKKQNRKHRITVRLNDQELKTLRAIAKGFKGSVSKAVQYLIPLNRKAQPSSKSFWEVKP